VKHPPPLEESNSEEAPDKKTGHWNKCGLGANKDPQITDVKSQVEAEKILSRGVNLSGSALVANEK
jgi:hypothetical protein